MYYVRATGDNRYGGGTDKWLRIRGMKTHTDRHVLEVRIREHKMFVAVSKSQIPGNLEFGEGIWPNIKPVSHVRIVEGMTI